MSAPSPEALELNRLVIEEITSKWSLLILGRLCGGPLRFNALRRANEGITQRALTHCLRRLEASGFIKRSVVSTAPVAVMYEISALGRSLEPHLRSLLQWRKIIGSKSGPHSALSPRWDQGHHPEKTS